MEDIKTRILNLLEQCHVVPELIVFSNVGFDYSDDKVRKALSEMTQASEIRRYEYILSGESMRRCFYMPIGSRIMF